MPQCYTLSSQLHSGIAIWRRCLVLLKYYHPRFCLLACDHQAALPQILEKTRDDFFTKTLHALREVADACHDKIQEIPCITCPYIPQGSMFAMVCKCLYVAKCS